MFQSLPKVVNNNYAPNLFLTTAFAEIDKPKQ